MPSSASRRKPKPPVKVRACSVRVHRRSVADAIDAEIEGAVRGAILRAFKHRDEEISDDATEAIVTEAQTRIAGVLFTWLDFGDEP